MNWLHRSILMTSVTICSVIAGPTFAGESEAEALYSRYHQAIEAAKICRNLEFDQNAHDAMAAVIHRRIEHKIGAKRLPLLTAAQRETRGIVEKAGCDDSRIQDLLALFDEELAATLP